MHSLLGAVARSGPTLIMVDDLQWLDQESIDVLAFVARRLDADGIGMVMAERSDSAVRAFDHLPTLHVAGLASSDALTLLHRVVTRPLEARISDQIVTATDGNPLAIIDLAQELSTHQLVGLTLLPEPMPVGSHLQAHYLRQRQSLPENVQTWLLLAHAEPSGDPAYVAAAAAVLGIDVDAGDLAEARNLVRTDDRISFRHPLVRSAIYSGATGGQRRRVHNALAAVTRRAADVDRRAWHLAAGCTRPDEEVADVLEQAAGRARERGGYSARASLLAPAVELSPDGPGKVGRTLDAAEAAMTAGRAMQTLAFLDALESAPDRPKGHPRLPGSSPSRGARRAAASATPEGMQPAHGQQARPDAPQGGHEGTRKADRAPTGDLGQPRLLPAGAASTTGVAALQRSVGNRAVSCLLAPVQPPAIQPPAIQRPAIQRQTPPPPTAAPPTAAPPSGAMTRARFVELLGSRYGISTVRAGTFADQQEVNSRPGVSGDGRLTEASWAAWDPGSTSEIYSSVMTAFDDFESSVGGVPPVNEVLFFATAYSLNPATHRVEPNAGIGADFGAGHLRVYRSGVASGAGGGKGIPTGRSTAGGRYPAVVIGLGGRGSDPGAPIPLPTAGENTVRVITHELGHGLAEQAMAADHAMFDQYRLAVGWTDGRLFDVGIPEVRLALDAGTIPPATIRTNLGGRVTVRPTQITVDSWNHPRWVEQPISAYTVTGGPGEDFAEAMMGYVNARMVLQARSPVRFGFLESHRASWLPFLTRRPPVGDFLGPSGPGRLA